MENQDFSPPHVDASRPSLGFPLGTALLLIIIFSLSGIFSCCYHWDKLRSLRRSFASDASDSADLENGPIKPNASNSVIFLYFWVIYVINKSFRALFAIFLFSFWDLLKY
uniref:Uncharacterized protein n=1 Tax=Cannabis sativa TaxID=3483 RepID=A0A803R0D1_CANSA